MRSRRGASIHVIYGPMFSGKTEFVIGQLERAEASGMRVAAIKPAVDVREGESALVSHTGRRYPALRLDHSHEIIGVADAFELVAVDEIQFFDDAVADVAAHLRDAGVDFLAAGLDFNFRREPFASTAAVIEIADEMTQLVAVCGKCGGRATLTQRLLNGVPAPVTDDAIRVGGLGLYDPRCDACHRAEDVRRAAPAAASTS